MASQGAPVAPDGHNAAMPTPPSQRSVTIDDDERGGWSSDRPRRDGAPRPADLTVRCRVLRPADRLRYVPGSLLVVVSPSVDVAEAFAERLAEDRAGLLSPGRVRKLLAGRVPDEQVGEKAAELLEAAVRKRLEAGESVMLVVEGLEPELREPFVRAAFASRRGCHLILVETPRDEVDDEDRPVLNRLRTALDAGELGAEGFRTALRLGSGSAADLKRVVFRAPPRDE